MSDRYELRSAHKFYDVTRSIVGNEIRMGDTVTLLNEVDLTMAVDVRARLGAEGHAKPSYTAFVIKSVALALREFPYANRRIYKRAWLQFSRLKIQQFTAVDMTVAVERDIPGVEVATFVDVLRDAEKMSLADITQRLHELATCDASNNKQWREYTSIVNRLPAWLSKFLIGLPLHSPSMWSRYRGGAALISSPAKYGVDAIVGAWTAPIGVSFGFVKERAVVKNGRIVACPTFMLTVNFDRRVMAGAQAARFYKRIVDRLEDAATLLSPGEFAMLSRSEPTPGGKRAASEPALPAAVAQGVAMMSA
jgi:pyruvate/2-oxoglutarate dehydrogenase complex dihydrolipoamide acyltransferase (E2) component